MDIQKVALLLAPNEVAFSQTPANFPPLALGVISGYLRKQGLEVQSYDLNLDLTDLAPQVDKEALQPLYNKDAVIGYLNGNEKPSLQSFVESLLADKDLSPYDLVGLSCGADFSWMEIHSTFLMGKYIQQKYGIPVVFGGNNIDYLFQFADDTYRDLWTSVLDHFRFVFVGPGENTLYQLIQILNKKSDLPLEDLPGLIYRDPQGRVVSNAKQKPLVVKPDFQGLHQERYVNYLLDSQKAGLGEDAEKVNLMQLYKWPSHMARFASDGNAHQVGQGAIGKLVIPYIFNYNCPYRCAFCVQSSESHKDLVIGSASQVVDDIAEMIKEYDTPYFYFLNNAFNYSHRFVTEFCQLVQERGLKFYWSDCGRFNGLTYDLLKMMRDAGCQKLSFGFETGSDKLLKLVDKQLDLAQAERVLEWCQQLGIWTDVAVIVGFPHENDEDFDFTCKFLEEHRQLINWCVLTSFFVIPDSLMGRHPEKYGLQIVKDKAAYEHLLEVNFKWFTSNKGVAHKPQNFAIYRFNEIDGRKYREVSQATRRKAAAFRTKLYQPDEYREFAESWHTFTTLHARLDDKHQV